LIIVAAIGVEVGTGVSGLGVDVRVGLCVFVGFGVADGEGDAVAEAVALGDGVLDGLGEGVTEADALGEGEEVAVGLEDGVVDGGVVGVGVEGGGPVKLRSSKYATAPSSASINTLAFAESASEGAVPLTEIE
jgi:hypothetical protein